MTDPIGNAAWSEAYYDAGWVSVLPLPPRQKSEPAKGFTGRRGVDMRREDAREQFAGNPELNVALRMPDNVIGIDVDAYDDKIGDETLAELEHGLRGREALGELPATWVSSSRDDGVSSIRFYRVPAGQRWLSEAGIHIEVIKRAHRYAVVAPSVHPEGRKYTWRTPDGMYSGRPPKVDELTELPASWVEGLKDPRAGAVMVWEGAASVPRSEAVEILKGFKPGPPCSCVQTWGEEALRAARRQGPTREAHTDLLRPVMQLLRQGTTGVCTGAGDALREAMQAYSAWDEDHAADFLTMIETTIPKAIGAGLWICDDDVKDIFTVPAPSLELETVTESTVVVAEPLEDDNPLGYVTWDDDFWNPPPPVYFIPQMLIESQVCTIYSAGGLGKSLLAQDIAIGLSVRGTVFGIEVERQPVLYIDRENSRRGLMKRLRAMGLYGVAIPDLHYSLLGSWPALDTRTGGRMLVAEVERTGARFVVLDTLSKVVDGEENSNDTWKGLHNHTIVALKKLGCTILQLDHTGKDADRGQRGGSSKHDNVEVVWHLTNTATGYVQLVKKKDRDDDYPDVINLERSEHPRLEHRLIEELPAAAAHEIAEQEAADRLIVEMDRLGIPVRDGRTKAGEALSRAGVTFNNNDLARALRDRKERAS